MQELFDIQIIFESVQEKCYIEISFGTAQEKFIIHLLFKYVQEEFDIMITSVQEKFYVQLILDSAQEKFFVQGLKSKCSTNILHCALLPLVRSWIFGNHDAIKFFAGDVDGTEYGVYDS